MKKFPHMGQYWAIHPFWVCKPNVDSVRYVMQFSKQYHQLIDVIFLLAFSFIVLKGLVSLIIMYLKLVTLSFHPPTHFLVKLSTKLFHQLSEELSNNLAVFILKMCGKMENKFFMKIFKTYKIYSYKKSPCLQKY